MRFPILAHRTYWFFLSLGLVTISLVSIAIFGLNLGIDFTGGTRLQIAFESAPSNEELQKNFRAALGEEKHEKITRVLEKNDLLLTTRSLSKEEQARFEASLAKKDWGAKIIQINTVSPSIGSVFAKRAVWAILLAITVIILFVAFAFRKVPAGLSSWRFGMAAIVALAHDILIILGFFALLGAIRGTEVDTLFVTALLTVLGFSVNDTIVIFDRIRENIHGKSASLFEQITEHSLWQSMRRSLFTSASTLIVIATMLIFFRGFEDLFSFFLALSLGIVVGTYSSIFLAAPLLVTWHQYKEKKEH